jgi:long-chain fatty acid transport protein
MSPTLKTSRPAAAMAGLALASLASLAHAGNGLLPAGNGIAAYGRGGTGLAAAADAAAAIDNPALMARSGQSLAIGFSLFRQERELDMRGVNLAPLPLTGQLVPSDNELTAIPLFAYTGAAVGALHWGVQLYDMGGLNGQFRTGPVPEIRPEPQTVDLRGRIVAASLSWSATPTLTVGGSVLLAYQTLQTRNLLSTKELGTGHESSTGFGIKLGAHWQASDGISFGAIVQPAMHMSDIDYLGRFLAAFGYTGSATIPQPLQLGAGVQWALGDQKQTTLLVDLMHYRWSDEGFYEFFGWKDQTVIKLGIEHQLTPLLLLRAGVNYGKSPIRGGTRTGNDGNFVPQTGAEVPVDPGAPRGDGRLDAAFGNYPFVTATSQTHWTLGLGYRMSRDLVLNGFVLYSPQNVEVASGASLTPGGLLPPGSDIKMKQYAMGLGINYSF